MNATELAEYAESRVVTVYATDGTGSGFFIDDDGTLVTNYHVIEFAEELSVKFTDGASYAVTGVIKFSEKYDLAVLKVDISGNDYFETTTEFAKGQTVYAVGSSLGFIEGAFTNGIISNTEHKRGSATYIVTNANISSGNSGGPLLNEYGKVIGVNTASYTSGDGTNLSGYISMLDDITEEPNYSIGEYVNWWRNERNNSYLGYVYDSDGDQWYTTVNTYQVVNSGCKCRYSSTGSDFDIDEDRIEVGYDDDCYYYLYDYAQAEYDNYVEYLKGKGFVYEEDDSYGDYRVTQAVYLNRNTGVEVTLTKYNEGEFFSDPVLIIDVNCY